jgi:hypothetical protein
MVILPVLMVASLLWQPAAAFQPKPVITPASAPSRRPTEYLHQSLQTESRGSDVGGPTLVTSVKVPLPTSLRAMSSTSLGRAEKLRQTWIEQSVEYYSKVMREERRRSMGQLRVTDVNQPQYRENFVRLAKKHYFALRKIKENKPAHAEYIYRRIINEIVQVEGAEEHTCDHAQLAVTTLLLALHLQRERSDPRQTRSVFLNFFRIALIENGETQCACSAKVLQAFALFEMKQGNRLKSLQLANKAVELDSSLSPLLNWKQFQEAERDRQQKQHDRAGQRIAFPS